MPTQCDAQSIRIVLVDDHPLVMIGLRLILEEEECLTVVGEATNATEALSCIKEQEPDVVMLDLDLGELSDNGITVAKNLRKFSDAKIIAMSAKDSPVTVKQLLQHRISGFLLKQETPETIVKAVMKVGEGEHCYSGKIQGILSDNTSQNGFFSLSPRQREVMECLAKGLANKEISQKLKIELRTVENHTRAIYKVLGFSSRQEVSAWAWRNGVVI